MRFSYLLITAAGLAIAAALPAIAQAPVEEEELLGAPNAPITLRAQQPKPIARAPVAQPKPVVAPKPKAQRVVAAKPAPKPAVQPAKKPPVLARNEPRPTPPVKVPEPPRQAKPIVPQAEALPPHEDPAPILAAPEAPAPIEDATPVPDRDFAQIDRMIDAAARRGDIYPRTADIFIDELNEIADLQDQMLRQGAFGAEDREALDERLATLRNNIYAASEEQSDWRYRR